jgi:hypothetical protein
MSRSCPELAPRSSSLAAWQVSPEGCRSLDEAEILGLPRQEVNDYLSVTGASRLPAEGARPLLLIKALYPGRRRKTHFETAQQGGAVYAMG